MTLFVDGEPLDVDKLNKLSSTVEQLEAKIKPLTDKYDSVSQKVVSKIPIIHIGSPVTVNLIKGRVTQPIIVTSNEFNDADQVPRYFVSILKAGKAEVSFSISKPTKTGFTVIIDSSANANAEIQWVGIAEKTTQSN